MIRKKKSGSHSLLNDFLKQFSKLFLSQTTITHCTNYYDALLIYPHIHCCRFLTTLIAYYIVRVSLSPHFYHIIFVCVDKLIFLTIVKSAISRKTALQLINDLTAHSQQRKSLSKVQNQLKHMMIALISPLQLILVGSSGIF